MKIKNHHSYQLIIIFCCFLLVFNSCNKYLDKKQNSRLVVPSTLKDLQALLDDVGLMNKRTPSQLEACADEYFLTNEEFGYLEEASQKAYLWKPYFAGSDNDWSNCYIPVYNSNLVLDLIRKIPRRPENRVVWDNIKGSALFFRSYYFLELLWNFAKAYDSITANKDLGIALRTTSDYNVPSVRAYNDESYNKVISDVKASIFLLPNYSHVLTRPSRQAAYGLLARCYLSMRKYKDALVYADSALQLNYQLIDYNGDSDIPDGIDAQAPFNQLNKETIFYTLMNFNYYSYITTEIGSIDTAIIKLYTEKDLRLSAFYYENPTGCKSFKGSYGNNVIFSGLASDEILLIRAECNIRQGQITKGLDDLNELRSKRFPAQDFVKLSGLNKEQALDFVLNERRRELVMRGLRWMDLKRLNVEGRNISLKRTINGNTYLLPPNANFYALPIPEDIVNLTGMVQNAL